jgi:hypothetical protein
MTSWFAAAQPVISDDVRQAAARLASRARRTPVFAVRIDGRHRSRGHCLPAGA